jgi:hypothetical protein
LLHLKVNEDGGRYVVHGRRLIIGPSKEKEEIQGIRSQALFQATY